MTVEVPLTQGLVALIDDEDAPAVFAAGKWCASYCDGIPYAGRSVGLKTVRMHTFLTGWPLVDHANRDGLDNRRANLRPATTSQNNANRRRSSNNTSGFKGVNFYRRTGRWRAYLGANTHLGYFDTAEEAARAYDAAALTAWGEFALTNFSYDSLDVA